MTVQGAQAQSVSLGRRLSWVVIAFTLAAGLSGLAAAATPTWTVERVPKPADADGVGPRVLSGLSCPTDNWCAGVGSYRDTSGREEAFFVIRHDNGLHVTRAPLPADANFNPSARPQAISCASAHRCVALIYYNDGQSTGNAIETLRNGAWRVIRAPRPSPDDATLTQLQALSCSSSTKCVAVGVEIKARVVVVDQLDGTTWTPHIFPLPANAPAPAVVDLNDVSCPTADWCVAVGGYGSMDGTNAATTPIAVKLSSGTWLSTELPVPSDAKDYAPHEELVGDLVYAERVSCPKVGRCEAAGQYMDGDGYPAMFERLTNGRWQSRRAPMTNDEQDRVDDNTPFVSIADLACASVTKCVAVGSYASLDGVKQHGWGLIERYVDGSWHARDAHLPRSRPSSSESALFSVSCPRASWCIAVGTVGDSLQRGLIETLKGHRLSARKDVLPRDAASSKHYSTDLSQVSCSSVGTCLAVGNYVDTHGQTLPHVNVRH